MRSVAGWLLMRLQKTSVTNIMNSAGTTCGELEAFTLSGSADKRVGIMGGQDARRGGGGGNIG